MNLRNYRDMDPQLLLGLVNTALRNDFSDLADLVKGHDLCEEQLRRRLADIRMEYRPEQNQFRPARED